MRIVIAEDAALIREGLTHILDHFGHQVRTVADAPGLLAEVAHASALTAVTGLRERARVRSVA